MKTHTSLQVQIIIKQNILYPELFLAKLFLCAVGIRIMDSPRIQMVKCSPIIEWSTIWMPFENRTKISLPFRSPFKLRSGTQMSFDYHYHSNWRHLNTGLVYYLNSSIIWMSIFRIPTVQYFVVRTLVLYKEGWVWLTFTFCYFRPPGWTPQHVCRWNCCCNETCSGTYIQSFRITILWIPKA